MTELVKVRLRCRVADDPTIKPFRCYFLWSDRDPYAVHIQLPGVTWMFCRDLLAKGLLGPEGDGDVYITPAPANSVDITLSSPTGEATLRFDHDDLLDALDATWRVVERGHEHIDFDSELESLLEGQS